MSFLQRFFQVLTVAAAVSAGSQAVASQGPASMPLGSSALPPTSYVEFCGRQPAACGADPAQVLADAARVQAERAALLGLPVAAAAQAATVAAASPAAAPALAAVELPAMTPALWAKLNAVNARVNRAIRPRTDAAGYGVSDFWTLPLEEGRNLGDCEDYALEKMRALVGEGVPRSALNLAIATTDKGESHAVLTIATRSGDFVLDNLSASVRRWDAVPYRWRQRQVGGEAFTWAMVRQPPVRAGV